MRRLIGAEARRWVSRRGLWAGVLGAVFLAGLLAASLWVAARPPSPADLAAAQGYYEQAHASWLECAAGLSDEAAVATCSEPPHPDAFTSRAADWESSVSLAAYGSAAIGSVASLLLAASLWGAEFRHGTIGTWLTFVPSRTRVWLSRTGVAVVAGALLTAAVSTLTLGVVWLAFVTLQGAGSVGGWGSVVGPVGRGITLAALMALAGSALAITFRSTVAAVALPLAYLFLLGFTGILSLAPSLGWLHPFLPELNVSAFLAGGWGYQVPVGSAADGSITYVDHWLSMEHGLVYLVVVCGLAALGSLALFHRRDVSD